MSLGCGSPKHLTGTCGDLSSRWKLVRWNTAPSHRIGGLAATKVARIRTILETILKERPQDCTDGMTGGGGAHRQADRQTDAGLLPYR